MKKHNLFTRHPQEVRMSYLQHARFALMLSLQTCSCAIGSLVHAFLPFLFVTHTSRTIRKLQDIFDQREQDQPLTLPANREVPGRHKTTIIKNQHGNKSKRKSDIQSVTTT